MHNEHTLERVTTKERRSLSKKPGFFFLRAKKLNFKARWKSVKNPKQHQKKREVKQKIRQQRKQSTQKREIFFHFSSSWEGCLDRDDPDFERNVLSERVSEDTRILILSLVFPLKLRTNLNARALFFQSRWEHFSSEPLSGRERERDLFFEEFNQRERERERLKTYTLIYIHIKRERKREKFWADRAASSQSRTSFWSDKRLD